MLRVSRPTLLFLLGSLGLVGLPRGLASQPRTVVYPTPDRATVQQSDTIPVLTLGGDSGPEFHRITAIVPLSSGGFVVANAGTNSLWFFDRTGRRTHTAGRSGRGPGDFLDLAEVVTTRGDTLVVFDPINRQVAVVLADGTIHQAFSIVPPDDGGGAPTRLAAFPDGRLWVGFSDVTRMQPNPAPAYFTQRLYLYSVTGEVLPVPPTRLPESEHFVQQVPMRYGNVAYWDLAFGRRMILRGSPSGLFTGDGSDWSIQRRSPGGQILETHRLPLAVSPVTESDRRAFRAATLDGASASRRELMEGLAREMPFPRTKPAYRRFEVDGEGRVWIEPSGELFGKGVWLVLNPRLARASLVRLATDFRPLAFSRDHVFGVRRDADQVESVLVFRLP